MSSMSRTFNEQREERERERTTIKLSQRERTVKRGRRRRIDGNSGASIHKNGVFSKSHCGRSTCTYTHTPTKTIHYTHLKHSRETTATTTGHRRQGGHPTLVSTQTWSDLYMLLRCAEHEQKADTKRRRRRDVNLRSVGPASRTTTTQTIFVFRYYRRRSPRSLRCVPFLCGLFRSFRVSSRSRSSCVEQEDGKKKIPRRIHHTLFLDVVKVETFSRSAIFNFYPPQTNPLQIICVSTCTCSIY